jgi:hypothetical protein
MNPRQKNIQGQAQCATMLALDLVGGLVIKTVFVCVCTCLALLQVREPQPLTLHHLPFSHTYALFEVSAAPQLAAGLSDSLTSGQYALQTAATQL